MRLFALSAAVVVVVLAGCRTRPLDCEIDCVDTSIVVDATIIDARRSRPRIAMVGDAGVFPEDMLEALLAENASVQRIAAAGGR